MVKHKNGGARTFGDANKSDSLQVAAAEEVEEEEDHVIAMPPKAFKPYGSPPRFDLDEYKDSFELWHQQWKIFLALSTIDTVLDEDDRPAYKTNILLSCLTKETLQAVMSMGLTDAQLGDHETVIQKLRERCNAGRNRHVWRQQFALSKQRANEAADNWLCDLRELARKCEFAVDCCANCQPTRILGQLVYGVYDDEIRRKLLERGATLSLDQAIDILRVAEAASQQATNLKSGDAAAIQALPKSTYKKGKTQKQNNSNSSHHPARDKPSPSQSKENNKSDGCWNCGGKTRHSRQQCPANGKECNKCTKIGHFEKVCNSKKSTKLPQAGCITLDSSSPHRIAGIEETDLIEAGIQPSGSKKEVIISILPDTGAQIDAIPADMYQNEITEAKLLPRGTNAVTATGSPIVSDGTFKATIRWPKGNISKSIKTTFHVLQGLKQPVLSKSTQKALGMLPAGYPHDSVYAIKEEPVKDLSSKFFPHLMASVVVNPTEERKNEDRKILTADFPHIFDGVCRPMVGPACHFELKEGAVPVAFRGSRPVSEPLLPKLKKELNHLEEQKIVRKVTAPTAWVHPIVIAMKKDGDIRLCVDFTILNDNIIRPRFDTATPFQAVRTIPPGMKFFTVIDALKGYHQVQLDEESSALTTFSTPFGRYQYLRLPFGITHAGDDYSRRVSEVFDDIENSRRIVEDVIVFSATYEEHLKLVRRLFQRAADHNIAINVSKMVFAQPTAKFGGYIVSSQGFQPNPDLTKAIREFPQPKNITDVRAFHGLCQQVGNFSTKVAESLKPLSPLLKKDLTWEWTTTHEEAFLKAREALSETHDLAFYDQKRPTALHVDASRLFGLGFILKQKDANGSWRMVQAGSRYLSEAESRYAMIELECLGAAWAMQKCRQFIEGLPTFELITDHKPLVPILNDHSLDKLDNPRILRLRLKMQRYQFKARWVPGKENIDADALSRAPVDRASAKDELAEGAASSFTRLSLISAISGSDASVLDPVLERIKMAAQKDKQMIELRETIINGFPNDKCNLSLSLRPFWNMRSQLAIDEKDGMIVAGARIVIPAECRQPLLQDLINMHQGATKLRQRARLTVYWPGMDIDITNAARSCQSCTEKLPSLPREPLIQHQAATRPFEQLHSDLATINGRDFLIIADQYSGWPDVIPFPNKNTTARRVVDAVREFFIRGPGAPVKFWSDNGPQFNAVEFKDFARDWGISIGNSAPHYPQSNGFAEAAISSMKKLIAGSWRKGSFDVNQFAKSILLFRNAPRSGAASPAQMVFNRPVRDALPAHRRSFAPEWQQKADILEKRARRAK